MRIGVPRETRPGERLVAATPRTVAQLVDLGYDVVVERGAGERASYPDEAYVEAGASLGDAAQAWGADVVTAVNAPSAAQVAALTPGQMLIAMLAPGASEALVQQLADRGVTAWPSTRCRASRAPSRSTCSARCRTSPGTVP